jgi:iron complex transport system substrate-binding protein
MMKKSRYYLVCRKCFLHDFPSSHPFIIYTFGLLLVLFAACKQSAKQAASAVPNITQSVTTGKTVIRHSKGFTIDYFGNYKLVKILNHFSDRSDTLQYLLVQRGTPVPTNYPGAQVIQIPVQKMVVTSSMHIALADYASAANVITGLAESKYVTSPIVRRNIAAGKVVEVGNGGAMNHELIISMKPDLLMTTGSPDAQFSRYQTLIGAGVPVMINSEWLETDPLGRAEWAKLMAALLNKEEVVNQKFEQIEQEYNRLKSLAAKTMVKPNVVIGMPFKGSWFVPDGDSYITQFLKDAGADYHWSGVKSTGSLALDFETVAPVALKADFWLNPSSATAKEEIAAKDPRYTHFKSFEQGTIYNNNKRTNDIGANDYWESGAVNPHLILADLIKIFHPELLPEHQFVYYKQIQ